MPPGDRIKRLFEEKIEPVLAKQCFRFIKSKNLFKRTVGPFTQEIIISKSKWNRGDEICSFWIIFSVLADTYNDWHNKLYGRLPINNVVTSFYHNHLKNWNTEFKLDKYDLSTQDNNKVFEEISSNIIKIVLPLFDKYSDYESAADTLMQNKQYWWGAKIFDYYIISEKVDKADKALNICKEYFDKQVEPPKELFEELIVRINEA